MRLQGAHLLFLLMFLLVLSLCPPLFLMRPLKQFVQHCEGCWGLPGPVLRLLARSPLNSPCSVGEIV